MKVLATLLSSAILCSSVAFGQDAAMAAATAACGSKEDKMRMSSENAKNVLTQPEPGKALVYVIEDDGVANRILGGNITWRIGMDGSWLGAMNRHSPYIAFSVAPGEHHLCANWQSSLGYLAKATSVAHLDAEAEKTYYFRVREWESQTVVFIDLAAVDGDQAKLLIALQPATSRDKK
jgi:hypothetical protein